MTHGETVGPSPIARNTGECDWKRAHTELVRLAANQARLDWDVGSWLLKAVRSGTPLRLGYGSIIEYAHRLFGYEARFTNERLRVAEALEELPELSRALRDGCSNWSVVRELTRVATPETEAEWIAVARGRTSREVERLVSGDRPGDRPDDPADAALLRHVLRFEVRAETRALMREALAKLRREAGGRLDDDAALLLMARQILGGAKDAGRSNYQLAVTRCGDCLRAHVHASGERVEVDPEVLEMIECDVQHIGPVARGSVAQEGTSTRVGNGAGYRSKSGPPRPARTRDAVSPARGAARGVSSGQRTLQGPWLSPRSFSGYPPHRAARRRRQSQSRFSHPTLRSSSRRDPSRRADLPDGYPRASSSIMLMVRGMAVWSHRSRPRCGPRHFRRFADSGFARPK